MRDCITGRYNTAVGSYALALCSNGEYNTALGYGAAYNNTTADDNVALGRYTLFTNTTGIRNVAIGADALRLGTTEDFYYNTAVGYKALENTTRFHNTAVGYEALTACTTGFGNSALGYWAGKGNLGGYYNTYVGWEAGDNITTGYNNTVLGYDAKASSATVNNEFTLGNNSVTTLRCQQTSITALSDRRDKTNIVDLDQGIDFISALKPVSFEWKCRDGSLEGVKEFGFIAQDLAETENNFGVTEYLRLVLKNNPDKLEARPMQTYPILIKAVQQLIEKVKSLEVEVANLKLAT